MSAFIINSNNLSVAGFVQNNEVAAEKAAEGQVVVGSATDLEGMSLQQLTDIFNGVSGAAPVGKFKIAKDKAAVKVYAALTAIDTATLVQLDAETEKKVEDTAKIIAQEEVAAAAAAPLDANGKKIRKVRDSKLQRMKAAFLTTEEDGSFKQWTVKELMEKCGTTERITHVYISILRSPSDRFVMNIEKQPLVAGQSPQFVYKPKDKAEAKAAAEQVAA